MSSATRFVDEYCQPDDLKTEKTQRKTKKGQEFVWGRDEPKWNEMDTARLRLKIHFVGFSKEYEECRDFCSERNITFLSFS